MSQFEEDPFAEKLFELDHCREYIPPADCKAGAVYWIGSRRISSIAICQRTDRGVEFKGLREKLGDYFLFNETHWDDEGTAWPYLEMGEAPELEGEELMYWFQDQEIEITEMYIEWLRGMPMPYKRSATYRAMLEDARESLNELRDVREHGFDSVPKLTFRGIMEAAAKAKEARLAEAAGGL